MATLIDSGAYLLTYNRYIGLTLIQAEWLRRRFF